MPIWVKNKGGDFTPAPAGLHHAVCVDAVDLGLVEGNFGKKPMVSLAWQTKALMDSGKPYLVIKRYGASLHPKAKLRADLESWRGRAFTEDEAVEFDLERLIGANCQLMIIHNIKDGTTYGNVASIVPAPSVLGKLQARDYVRVQDRDGYKPPAVEGPEPGSDDGPPVEGDIAF